MNWYVIVWEQHEHRRSSLSIPGLSSWIKTEFGKTHSPGEHDRAFMEAAQRHCLYPGSWPLFDSDQEDYPNLISCFTNARLVRVMVVPQHAAPMMEFHGDEDGPDEESFDWGGRTVRAIAECKTWGDASKKARELWHDWSVIFDEENGVDESAAWKNLGLLWEQFRHDAVKAGYSLPPESERGWKEAA